MVVSPVGRCCVTAGTDVVERSQIEELDNIDRLMRFAEQCQILFAHEMRPRRSITRPHFAVP
jgi:hypothetical protein